MNVTSFIGCLVQIKDAVEVARNFREPPWAILLTLRSSGLILGASTCTWSNTIILMYFEFGSSNLTIPPTLAHSAGCFIVFH